MVSSMRQQATQRSSTTHMQRACRRLHQISGIRVVLFLQCEYSLRCEASWLTDGCSCHGEAIFPGVIDSKTGKSVIAGKTITGFTTQAEEEMGIMEPIRSWGEPLIDEWAKKLGAKCKSTSLKESRSSSCHHSR